MKREIRYLYLLMLKNKKRILNIDKYIGYYYLYRDLAGKAYDDPDCPVSIQQNIIILSRPRPPKYLKWVEKYLVKGDKVE